jgi:uncharacterized protein YaiI (UPF0178 family)
MVVLANQHFFTKPSASLIERHKARPYSKTSKGREFTEDGIGEALATRTVMDLHRQPGEANGGPAAMDDRSRSRVLSKLDELVNRIRKEQRDSPHA